VFVLIFAKLSQKKCPKNANECKKYKTLQQNVQKTCKNKRKMREKIAPHVRKTCQKHCQQPYQPAKHNQKTTKYLQNTCQ